MVPSSFKAQINQGVPGPTKARPDPLGEGKKIVQNKKNPCDFSQAFADAKSGAAVQGRTQETAQAFAAVEAALDAADYSTAVRTCWYLKLLTFINEDLANVWAYAAFAFAHLGYAEHVGFALKKMREAGMDQTVLRPEVMVELKKVSA